MKGEKKNLIEESGDVFDRDMWNTFTVNRREFLDWCESHFDSEYWDAMDYSSVDGEVSEWSVKFDEWLNMLSKRAWHGDVWIDMSFMQYLPEEFPVEVQYRENFDNNDSDMSPDKLPDSNDEYQSDVEKYSVSMCALDGDAPETTEFKKHLSREELGLFEDMLEDYIKHNFSRIASEMDSRFEYTDYEDIEDGSDIFSYNEGKSRNGKLSLTEDKLRSIVLEGTRMVLKQMLSESRADGEETVMVNMDQAFYELEKGSVRGLDLDADWIQDLPYEVPVRVDYSIEGGDPDTYSAPGTGTSYHVLSVKIQGFDLSELPGDQSELIQYAVKNCVENNFQNFMEGDYQNLSKPSRRMS